MLRQYCKEQRGAMIPEQKQRLDGALCRNVLSTWHYKKCGLLLAYVSTSDEPDTRRIIRQALREGKEVAAPYCVPGTPLMEFYLILSLDEMVHSAYGIMEPKPDPARRVRDDADGICLVPGLCFDYRGYRVGYGKGYYDRFLANYRGYSLGLSYSPFLYRRVPAGRYDQRVNALVTDQSIRYFFR